MYTSRFFSGGVTEYPSASLKLKPLAQCTVEEIQTISQSGEAYQCWNVGDSYPVTLNGTVGNYTFDNETQYITIVGMNHNAELETDGLPSVTFQFGVSEDGTRTAFVDDYYGWSGNAEGFKMNTSVSNSGGWEASYMRNTICQQFLEAMPTEWQNIIKPTIKYTDNTGGGSTASANVTATEDKIFLLSYHEVGFTSTYANSYEANYTEPYSDYYSSNDDRIKYESSATDTACIWFLRSPYRTNSNNFCDVTAAGASGMTGSYYSYGFAPAFTIF